ncbi:MAG: hypothetical protein ABMB14_41245 [Myxococcota bacterium]
MHDAVIGLWWLTRVASAGECDARGLMEIVGDAELAFVHMDAQTFESAAARLDRALDCQTDALTAIQIASYHKVRALAAFFDADEAATILSFQAALNTMPGYALPLEIAPDGNPLRQQFEKAKLYAPGETFDLSPPADGWLTIDGVRTTAAPASRPFVFQRFGSAGEVQDTDYVAVGSPVPSYPKVAVAVTRDVEPDPPKKKVNGALVGSGIALGAVSAGLYGVAFATRGAYDDAVLAGDEPKIRSNYGTTNGLVLGSGASLALGTSLFLVGVF